jgi:microcystin degradation protein MlrC
MRVYLPFTLPELARLLAEDQTAAPVRGYAVTPALREWYSSGDEEELEYVALTQAARASLRLLLADPGAPGRRVVLAAELPEEQVSGVAGFDEPALVEIKVAVRVRDVVSGHIDDPGAAADVRAAVAALAAADGGDDDARFVVGGAEGHELMWYATQELPHVTG